jgi:hypothetical protein
LRTSSSAAFPTQTTEGTKLTGSIDDTTRERLISSCDALDPMSLADELPDMDLGDFVYAQNIGAYPRHLFNDVPPARVVHMNQ